MTTPDQAGTEEDLGPVLGTGAKGDPADQTIDPVGYTRLGSDTPAVEGDPAPAPSAPLDPPPSDPPNGDTGATGASDAGGDTNGAQS